MARFVGVEDGPVGGVADGVCVDLEPAAHRPGDRRLEHVGRHLHQAARVRVGVVGEEGGPAAAERAVGVELDRADDEAAGGVHEARVGVGRAEGVDGVRLDHRIDAERQPAAAGGPLVEPERRERDAGLVDAREAGARRLGRRPGQRLGPVGRRHRGHAVGDERLGGVDEDPGRAALRVACDRPAGRVGRGGGIRIDAGRAERGGVGPRGVPVDALEPDGPVGKGGVEIVPRREGPVAVPVVLVPPAPEQPRTRRERPGEGDETLADLGAGTPCRRGRPARASARGRAGARGRR